jgi:hypothetical protein
MVDEFDTGTLDSIGTAVAPAILKNPVEPKSKSITETEQ